MRASGWCSQITTENDMSGLCSENKEKNSQVSGDNKLVPHLQCVTVHNQRVCLIVDWPIQIVQPQVRNRP